jgi:CDP-paratose 2-epimerase
LGLQVRDAFHPEDLAQLLLLQMRDREPSGERIFNTGGGASNAMSLAELTAICDRKFGAHAPQADSSVRPFDLPWVVMDSALVQQRFGWKRRRTLFSIVDEIAEHARSHPEWLDVCEGKRT